MTSAILIWLGRMSDAWIAAADRIAAEFGAYALQGGSRGWFVGDPAVENALLTELEACGLWRGSEPSEVGKGDRR